MRKIMGVTSKCTGVDSRSTGVDSGQIGVDSCLRGVDSRDWGSTLSESSENEVLRLCGRSRLGKSEMARDSGKF